MSKQAQFEKKKRATAKHMDKQANKQVVKDTIDACWKKKLNEEDNNERLVKEILITVKKTHKLSDKQKRCLIIFLVNRGIYN